jgi:hypothetical protein
MLTPLVMERFWAKVTIAQADECWLWTRATNEKGYGIFGIGKRTYRAHRVAWVSVKQQILSDDLELCHTCNVRVCMNTHHMYEGTHVQNLGDMWLSGNGSLPPIWKGESNSAAKLNEVQVEEIRALYREHEATQDQLAALYGISQAMVSNVINHKNWRG